MRLAARAEKISPSPTLSIDAQAKKMIAAGEKVINFSAGEPDFDTPEHIKQAAIEALQKGMTKYTPVDGTPALKEAIRKKFNEENGLDYKPEQIVVSCGAKHSLYNAIQVICEPGDEIILPAPYWVSYLEQIKMAGGQPVIPQTRVKNGFKLTVGELESVVSPRTRMIILNSPSNPTGAVYTREEISALGEVLLRRGIIIISDEIYEKFIYDGLEHVSIASLAPGLKELTIVINGVSKAYAMTGWRIGYAAAPTPLARAMANLQSHSTSNPTSIAQEASIAALTGTRAPLFQMVAEFNRRRDYMLECLLDIPGISCPRPGGSFYLFPSIERFIGRAYKGKHIDSASELAAILLAEAKVAVVPGVAFGDDKCFRLSYATAMEDIREGLDRIGEILIAVK